MDHTERRMILEVRDIGARRYVVRALGLHYTLWTSPLPDGSFDVWLSGRDHEGPYAHGDTEEQAIGAALRFLLPEASTIPGAMELKLW